MQESHLTDPDGVDVFFRRWPADEPGGVVVVSHGLSEHSARYARFADALNAAGLDVVALDHRGHGRTAESTGLGRIGDGGRQRFVDDLDLVVGHAVESADGAAAVLFGHSMGAVIAQAYVNQHGGALVGYVLSGVPAPSDGAAAMVEAIGAAVEAGMTDEPVAVLGGFNEAFEPARTSYDWLTRDEAEVDAYIADTLCGDEAPPTYGFLYEFLQLALESTDPDVLGATGTPPVLLVTGGEDPAAERGATARELSRRLGSAGFDVTEYFYEGARHELLNETNRDEVTADLVSWITARV